LEERTLNQMLDQLTLNDPTLRDVMFDSKIIHEEGKLGDNSDDDDFEVERKMDAEHLLANPKVQKKLRSIIVTESILKLVLKQILRKNLKYTDESIFAHMSSDLKLNAVFTRSKLILDNHNGTRSFFGGGRMRRLN